MVVNYSKLTSVHLPLSLKMIGTVAVDSRTAFPEKSATSGVEKIGVISNVADPIFSLETTKRNLHYIRKRKLNHELCQAYPVKKHFVNNSLFYLLCSAALMMRIFRLFLLNFLRMTDSAAENEYSHLPRRTGTLTEGATKNGGSVEMQVVLHTGAYVYLEVF